jgi:DNA-binding LacI/PurR family transcriptional regulator
VARVQCATEPSAASCKGMSMASRRFGVLLNQTRCAYSFALVDALEVAASVRQIQLELWPVPWATANTEIGRAEVDELLERAPTIDGLVVIGSVFSHGIKSLSKFAQAWWPRPAACIGHRLPLVPAVVLDNRGAMYAATRHLISEHGRRSLVFIRGRADSQEAVDRYYGFRQALTESQIIYDGTCVLQGDFTRESAVKALGGLAPELHFDGLIASNDEMAFGAMQELERSGRRIPHDVAVIGFDDVPAAAKSLPRLTTMAQPYGALASKSLDLVIDQCEGRDVTGTSNVPGTFVTRASCGCAGAALPLPMMSGRPRKI